MWTLVHKRVYPRLGQKRTCTNNKKETKREYDRQYYLAKKEAKKEAASQNYLANKEAKEEYFRQYYAENKVCSENPLVSRFHCSAFSSTSANFFRKSLNRTTLKTKTRRRILSEKPNTNIILPTRRRKKSTTESTTSRRKRSLQDQRKRTRKSKRVKIMAKNLVLTKRNYMKEQTQEKIVLTRKRYL